MRRLLTAVIFMLLCIAHVVILEKASESRNTLPVVNDTEEMVLPSSVLKISSGEFDSLVSDYLFLKMLVFAGEKTDERGSVIMTDQEWRLFYQTLEASSDLDPYFVDPYFIGNAFLTWDGNMIKEANALLEKGSRHRDWDWSLPFFLGFNHFFFLDDNEKAGTYMMEAARRPGASPSLAGLASKLAFKANRVETSIAFLEEIRNSTEDESLRKLYETRIEALRAILVLEQAVDVYRKKYTKRPLEIGDLITAKIIAEIPVDPYGGRFYIDKSGSIKTTSEKELLPHRR
ncbi:MAG: hypothetical protein OEW15_07005 [Nitrospirota bacterium]|nr:hypothetical protein [Nitrospirota bacterium]